MLRQSWRCLSSSSNPLPYPTHPNPHPHQIFHLPRSATQKQIKERYYDLVRIYHPDSPIARNYPAEIAQARFQSISKAYDQMRGKCSGTGQVTTRREHHVDPSRFKPKRPHFDETVGDDRWKERILLGVTLLAIVGFVAQTTITVARHNKVQSTHSPRTYALPDEALAEPPRPR